MAGGQNRTHGRTTWYRTVDSFQLARVLADRDSVRAKFGWSDGVEVAAEIDREQVMFSLNWDGNDIVQKVRLDWIPRGYGGENAYFSCPHCCRRARKLYMLRGWFRCRRCAKLHYPSQQNTKDDVVRMRVRRELYALGVPDEQMENGADVDSWTPDKPKGMHWDTYYTHLKRLEKARNEWNALYMRRALWVLKWWR